MCTYCNSQLQHKNDPAKNRNRNFDTPNECSLGILTFRVVPLYLAYEIQTSL